MKALVTPSQGAPAEVRNGIPVPVPSPTQLLVKTLYAAVNPVDAIVSQFGLLVESWPLVSGCEASGIVVSAGTEAQNPLGGYFQEGDLVAGCVRVGANGAFAEYFLLDAEVAFPKPGGLTMAQASTVTVGALTAFLGVFGELELDIQGTEQGNGAAEGKWALVFGGAGTVGKYAVQALKLAGCRVATTCSAASFELLKSLGADATIDYRKSPEQIVEEVKRVTQGRLELAFDAVSVNNELVAKIFTVIPSSSAQRLYTTTGPAPDAPVGFTVKPIALGPIGRPTAAEINSKVNSWIPVIYRLLESGKLKVGEYSVEGEGIEGILKAWETQKTGKLGSKKVIAKMADE